MLLKAKTIFPSKGFRFRLRELAFPQLVNLIRYLIPLVCLFKGVETNDPTNCSIYADDLQDGEEADLQDGEEATQVRKGVQKTERGEESCHVVEENAAIHAEQKEEKRCVGVEILGGSDRKMK